MRRTEGGSSGASCARAGGARRTSPTRRGGWRRGGNVLAGWEAPTSRRSMAVAVPGCRIDHDNRTRRSCVLRSVTAISRKEHPAGRGRDPRVPGGRLSPRGERRGARVRELSRSRGRGTGGAGAGVDPIRARRALRVAHGVGDVGGAEPDAERLAKDRSPSAERRIGERPATIPSGAPTRPSGARAGGAAAPPARRSPSCASSSEMSTAEVATTLGISKGTVKSSLARAQAHPDRYTGAP